MLACFEARDAESSSSSGHMGSASVGGSSAYIGGSSGHMVGVARHLGGDGSEMVESWGEDQQRDQQRDQQCDQQCDQECDQECDEDGDQESDQEGDEDEEPELVNQLTQVKIPSTPFFPPYVATPILPYVTNRIRFLSKIPSTPFFPICGDPSPPICHKSNSCFSFQLLERSELNEECLSALDDEARKEEELVPLQRLFPHRTHPLFPTCRKSNSLRKTLSPYIAPPISPHVGNRIL